MHPPPPPSRRLGAVVVAYESSAVLDECLVSLEASAPVRGVDVRVVDNASRDRSAEIAAGRLGEPRVVRLVANRGFAAGVNAGLAALGVFDGPSPPGAVAVLNPDARIAPGGLDRLADLLEAHPRAGLLGPRVVGEDGRPERNVGRFPTLARERHHALMLDRWLGLEGRSAPPPTILGEADWVSGCAWLLRTEAARTVGPLDEGYFMYYEDVDYGRRLHDAGWKVLAAPEVTVVHAIGRGSTGTSQVPADGGRAALRYFEKFEPAVAGQARAALVRGWRLRRLYRSLRARLGDRRSQALARRYELALASVEAP